jgi:hypothetical protein
MGLVSIVLESGSNFDNLNRALKRIPDHAAMANSAVKGAEYMGTRWAVVLGNGTAFIAHA